MVRADIQIEVRDGMAIGCQLYRPGTEARHPASGPFPSIVYNYTGYAAAAEAFGAQVAYYVERGYNAVVCQARGSGTAQGVSEPFGPQEQQDNYDVIEWIAAQPWSTGWVGQAGVSYGAHSALLVAVNRPPSLKAIIAVNGIHDWYENTIYRGGIYSEEYRENKRPAEVAAPSSGSLRTLSQSHSRRRAAGICGPFAGFSPRLGIRQAGLANSERRQSCRTQHRPFVFGRP